MVDLMQMSVGIAVAALVTSIFVIICVLIRGNLEQMHNKVFLIIIIILTINSLCGIITSVLDPLRGVLDVAFSTIQGFRYIYFLTHTALCPMFFVYTTSLTGSLFIRRKRQFFMMIPFAITEALVLINPFTHWCWNFDENRMFVRGWGEALIYIAALFYYVAALAAFRRVWKAMHPKRKASMMFFFGMAALGVLIQLIFKSIRAEIFMEILGFVGVLLSVEYEDDRIDVNLGVYNRAALSSDLRTELINRRPMQMLILRVTNNSAIVKAIGTENTDAIAREISAYLSSVTRHYYIYAANQSSFVLTIFDASHEEIENLASMISARFNIPWRSGEFEINVDLTILILDFLKRVNTVSEAMGMIDAPLPKNVEKKILYGKDVDYLIRRIAVEDAVSRGLDEGSFEVYYQPTYHIDRRLHGAEALLRMHDAKLGNLYPDEFIPIAERMGLIGEIDDFVLEEVCKFLKTGIPQECGLDSINVNLSVIQCMRTGFVEHISGIVEKYGVEKQDLNFEITESVAANDYKTLSRVVSELKEQGFLFSMDDFGTGYSNMSTIFSLNLDVIKIDKSLLWNSMDSAIGRIILENNVSMIRQIGKKILVEGVETEEHIRLLTGLKVDYLQGFFFSKPIDYKSFVQLIQEQKDKIE